jgi:hypothetical protein
VQRTSSDVDNFLAGLEGKPGEDMRVLDAAIVERMPAADRHLYEGKFWGGSDQQIIGYGVMDYTNRSGGGVGWFLVGLAAQKNYISLYVNAVVDGEYLLRRYEDRLGKVKVGSASVSFDDIERIDFESLMSMVDEAAETV